VDPSLARNGWAGEIAEQVLTHPMAARAGEKLAEVIHREELIKIVLEIGAAAAAPAPLAAAAGAGGNGAPAPAPPPPANNAGQALAQALQRAGIADPRATLDAVRMASMRLEGARPEMAAHVRETTALIAQAQSQFVANVNGWFDQTMDRVSHTYTNHSRYWTVGISLVLAIFLQLDAFKLVNRLSMDDALRGALVQQAQTQAALAAPTDAQSRDPAKLKQAAEEHLAKLRVLADVRLITLAPDFDAWWNGWSQTSTFGVLVSALLLSLGAPFWFKTLGKLLKLRPSLAAKEDEQRAQRQSSQEPAAVPGAAAMTVAAGGGRGGLPTG
jgi:hypothetical protein